MSQQQLVGAAVLLLVVACGRIGYDRGPARGADARPDSPTADVNGPSAGRAGSGPDASMTSDVRQELDVGERRDGNTTTRDTAPSAGGDGAAPCGAGCTYACPGGNEACLIELQPGGTAVCSGGKGCDVSCPNGMCRVRCAGGDGCSLSCRDDTCTMECPVAGGVRSCASGLSVCGRPCP